MLKLNDDKTEMVIFCSKHHLGQYSHCTINIGDSSIIPVSHVRNLGVQMDDHLVKSLLYEWRVIFSYTGYRQSAAT